MLQGRGLFVQCSRFPKQRRLRPRVRASIPLDRAFSWQFPGLICYALPFVIRNALIVGLG